MLHCGWDTDDLTDRQNYIFHKLNRNSTVGISLLALNFLSYSVKKNFGLKQFDNYEGDCDYLSFVKKETLEELGIDLETLYE